MDYSGWYFLASSEILAVLTESALFMANLGDTRAVLSTTSHSLAYGRNSIVSQQLTQEHRPEYTQEFNRITEHGGRVQKLLDLQGRQIGPYRVWEPNRNLPGLTISRSLGAEKGKELGVIASPNCTSYKINQKQDFFIVFASDGLWDVMDNQEVVNFVETYREHCVKGIDVHPDEDCVSFENTCIAQLLCEEARTRWVIKMEDEGISTDDISCVIVELKQCNFELEVVSDAEVRNTNLEEIHERETRKAPTLVDIVDRGTRKASMVGISILNSKTEM